MPPTDASQLLTTNRKALTINLDHNVYGTFAEIGAGQEVARHFFKAGGASCTIAKSLSAYDMIFSDAVYGKASRYVSRDRLMQMLDHEYDLLIQRLDGQRGEDTCFFVYANTVAVANYRGGNECHGWMGIRFQTSPRSVPNDIVIHVRMWDKTGQAQQDALGIIGVNFIYAAYVMRQNPDAFIPSLADNLGVERIEVDMLEFKGPDFPGIDNRAMSFKLMQHGLTNGVMFGPNQSVLQPSEAFYRKSILVERGSFRPITKLNIDMLECAGAQFIQEEKNRGEETMLLLEITVNNLVSEGKLDMADFLARVDTVTSLGYPVLISNVPEFFRLGAYFRRYTQNPVGMVMGLNNLFEVFNQKYYENLPGGILEACGRLFKQDTKLYIYPMRGDVFSQYLRQRAGITEAQKRDSKNASFLITALNVQFPAHLRSLYRYLLENNYIIPIEAHNTELLKIYSHDILQRLRKGEEGWETLVPESVADQITQKGLFGFPGKQP